MPVEVEVRYPRGGNPTSCDLSHDACSVLAHPRTEWPTDTCENLTFPQPSLRAVMNDSSLSLIDEAFCIISPVKRTSRLQKARKGFFHVVLHSCNIKCEFFILRAKDALYREHTQIEVDVHICCKSGERMYAKIDWNIVAFYSLCLWSMEFNVSCSIGV